MTGRYLVVVQWTLATAVAVVLANLVVDVLWFAVLGWGLFLLLPLGGLAVGFPVGLGQWLVLRRVWPGSGRWILGTSLGFVAAWVAGALFMAAATGLGDAAYYLAFAVATPLVGLGQWLVLRRRTPRAPVWIVASAVGWSVFAAVEVFAPRALAAVSDVAGRFVSWAAGYATASNVGATLLGGVLAGAITGLTLPWMLGGASPPSDASLPEA
jgi:hypothetical protein